MKKYMLFFVYVVLISISCDQKTDLNFRGIKSKIAKNLGENVWIDVPPFYKKAKSYDGFQAPKYESSISLRIDRESSLEDVRHSFRESQLSLKKQKLLEMTTFPFGDSDVAMYTVIKDKRKRTLRYQLSIQKDNDIYRIKAFCPERLVGKYENMIKRAFESVAFGETISKSELFSLAKLVSLQSMIYTKDGLYPTESEDEAVIEIKMLKTDSIANFNGIKTEYLNREMTILSDDRIQNGFIEKIGKGDYRVASIKTGDVKVFGVLLTDGEGAATMAIGRSNEEASLKEMQFFLRTMFVKTDLSW